MVALLKRGDKGFRKRHVRTLEVVCELPLVLVHAEEPLRSKRRNEEENAVHGENCGIREAPEPRPSARRAAPK